MRLLRSIKMQKGKTENEKKKYDHITIINMYALIGLFG